MLPGGATLLQAFLLNGAFMGADKAVEMACGLRYSRAHEEEADQAGLPEHSRAFPCSQHSPLRCNRESQLPSMGVACS